MTRAFPIACALLVVGCGKKGPPLAPISHIPAAIAAPAVTRVGNDLYVSFIVPTKDIDGSLPADVARIDVYGVTATQMPSPTQMLQAGARVASVPVAPPPLKGDTQPPTTEPIQGGTVSVRDALAPADLVPATLPTPLLRTPAAATPARPQAPAVGPAAAPALPVRYYMAIAYNERGRPGPPSAVTGAPLEPLPPPPPHLEATYTADTLTLTWQPAPGSQAGPGAPAVAATLYNVYRRLAPDPLAPAAPPPAAWAMTRPAPLNPAAVAGLAFADATQIGRQACYTVRTVRTGLTGALESEPSPELCVTAVDTFPPAAPKSLSAVAAGGAISLIWEPNGEADLGGYLVLRGEPGGDTLQPLTATPIAEAQFTDRTVQSGVRYVYAVVAVDDRLPVPNVSAESNRVEETAR